MKTLLYDGSLEGLFTSIFEVFEYKFKDVKIVMEKEAQPDFFAGEHIVYTSGEKAGRVLKRLEILLGQEGLHPLICTFLSERPDRETLILHFVRQVLANPQAIADYGDPMILEVSKITRSVGREKHRMEAFVRFEKLEDGLFFVKIEPDFDVLPLIRKHFVNRFQDQKWMIYDLRRNYALYYDLHSSDFFYPHQDFKVKSNGLFHETEDNYQALWKTYFEKTNIKERANTKLHVQHLPKRYWKYLTEKWI